MSDKSVENYDRTLHQALSKIFRERCLSSAQIKDFVRSLTFDNYATKLKILAEQEPVFSKLSCTEKEIGKLPLLWIAALAGYNNSAELLVRSGANVNEFCRLCTSVKAFLGPLIYPDRFWANNATIFHVMLQMRSLPERFIHLIMEHGADMNARDYVERTVLHYTVSDGRIYMTEMFIENGADVNAADNQGMTPLILAAQNQRGKELMPLLLKHGADVLARSNHGANALHYLPVMNSEVNSIDLAKVLIEKGVSVNDNDIKLYQPIYMAVLFVKNELVKLYLDHGANPNMLIAENGESLLHLAARSYNSTSMVETLLKHGANINLRCTAHGWNTLHFACHFFREDNIELLLSAGVDLFAEDNNGCTPFALMRFRDDLDRPGVNFMIRTLALNKVCRSSIEIKDEEIIKLDYPKLWNYYNGCFEEIEKMKATKLIESCTFFDLLAKSHRQIAALMRNPNFEPQFELYDLKEFPTYTQDITRAFKRAQNHYHAILEQKDVINEAVYGIFPYLVTRRVVDFIFN